MELWLKRESPLKWAFGKEEENGSDSEGALGSGLQVWGMQWGTESSSLWLRPTGGFRAWPLGVGWEVRLSPVPPRVGNTRHGSKQRTSEGQEARRPHRGGQQNPEASDPGSVCKWSLLQHKALWRIIKWFCWALAAQWLVHLFLLLEKNFHQKKYTHDRRVCCFLESQSSFYWFQRSLKLFHELTTWGRWLGWVGWGGG